MSTSWLHMLVSSWASAASQSSSVVSTRSHATAWDERTALGHGFDLSFDEPATYRIQSVPICRAIHRLVHSIVTYWIQC